MKLFYEWNVAEKTYKCRLNSRACVELEEKMGRNPLGIFIDIRLGKGMPKTKDVIEILYYAMKSFRPDLTYEDVYDIYDEWIDDGHAMEDAIEVLIEIFRVSGFFKAQTKQEETVKS